jgi:hypothetical protein
MALETFTNYLKDLVSTNPTSTDQKSQGDDHIRGLKSCLQGQFSGFTEAVAVTVKASDLNKVTTHDTDITTLQGEMTGLQTAGGPYMVEDGDTAAQLTIQSEVSQATANIAAAAWNVFLYNTGSTACTLTLTAGAAAGTQHQVYNASSANLTITNDTGETVDSIQGASTDVVVEPNSAAYCMKVTSTKWVVICKEV